MNLRNISPQALQEASNKGAKAVAEALSNFIHIEAQVQTSKVGVEAIKDIPKVIKSPEEEAVIVYSQKLSGIPGISLLTLSIDEALHLVDLLIGRERKTEAPGELTRSALMETLNIITNTYLTVVSDYLDTPVMPSPVSVTSPEKVEKIKNHLLSQTANPEKSLVAFEAGLSIEAKDIKLVLVLLFVFDEELVEMISE